MFPDVLPIISAVELVNLRYIVSVNVPVPEVEFYKIICVFALLL